jgi:hypothetical protein
MLVAKHGHLAKHKAVQLTLYSLIACCPSTCRSPDCCSRSRSSASSYRCKQHGTRRKCTALQRSAHGLCMLVTMTGVLSDPCMKALLTRGALPPVATAGAITLSRVKMLLCWRETAGSMRFLSKCLQATQQLTRGRAASCWNCWKLCAITYSRLSVPPSTRFSRLSSV